MYESLIDNFAAQAYRTILLCYREMSRDEYDTLAEENNNFENEEDRYILQENLVALGMFGIEDPLREGIPKAIKICNDAGITVVMCTGDNMKTARAIAIKAGILEEGKADDEYACMEGQQFEVLTEGLMDDPE